MKEGEKMKGNERVAVIDKQSDGREGQEKFRDSLIR